MLKWILKVTVLTALFYGGMLTANAADPIPVIGTVNSGFSSAAECDNLFPNSAEVINLGTIGLDKFTWIPIVIQGPTALCPVIAQGSEVMLLAASNELVTYISGNKVGAYSMNVPTVINSSLISPTHTPQFWQDLFNAPPVGDTASLELIGVWPIQFTHTPINGQTSSTTTIPFAMRQDFPPTDSLEYQQGEWMREIDNRGKKEDIFIILNGGSRINNIPQTAGSELLGNLCPAMVGKESAVIWEGFFYRPDFREWIVLFLWPSGSPTLKLCPNVGDYSFMAGTAALQLIPQQLLVEVKAKVKASANWFDLSEMLAFPDKNILEPQVVRGAVAVTVFGGTVAYYVTMQGGSIGGGGMAFFSAIETPKQAK